MCRGAFWGRRRVVPGKVDGVNEDGSYNIAYDDGDREENVQPALVRAVVPDAPDAPDEPGVDGGATASRLRTPRPHNRSQQLTRTRPTASSTSRPSTSARSCPRRGAWT